MILLVKGQFNNKKNYYIIVFFSLFAGKFWLDNTEMQWRHRLSLSLTSPQTPTNSSSPPAVQINNTNSLPLREMILQNQIQNEIKRNQQQQQLQQQQLLHNQNEILPPTSSPPILTVSSTERNRNILATHFEERDRLILQQQQQQQEHHKYQQRLELERDRCLNNNKSDLQKVNNEIAQKMLVDREREEMVPRLKTKGRIFLIS